VYFDTSTISFDGMELVIETNEILPKKCLNFSRQSRMLEVIFWFAAQAFDNEHLKASEECILAVRFRLFGILFCCIVRSLSSPLRFDSMNLSLYSWFIILSNFFEGDAD
jgi:hypothetical protein